MKNLNNTNTGMVFAKEDFEIFNNEDFGKLSIVKIDGEPHFLATKIAEALGYKNTIDAIDTHCEDVVQYRIQHPQSKDPNKTVLVNFIPESDLYSLIMGSKLPKAKAFKRWVCKEVLPSIKKHGMYAMDELLDNPDLAIQALTKLKEEREISKRLKEEKDRLALEVVYKEEVIKEQSPKVEYFNAVMASKEAVNVTVIAKQYDMKVDKFNLMLNDLRIQWKTGGVWVLYAGLNDEGYTKFATSKAGYQHMQWTQKGKKFLYDLLKEKKGLLPKN